MVKIWFFSSPALGLRLNRFSWQSPRGCRCRGSASLGRLAPAPSAGQTWMWCGFGVVCVFRRALHHGRCTLCRAVRLQEKMPDRLGVNGMLWLGICYYLLIKWLENVIYYFENIYKFFHTSLNKCIIVYSSKKRFLQDESAQLKATPFKAKRVANIRLVDTITHKQ